MRGEEAVSDLGASVMVQGVCAMWYVSVLKSKVTSWAKVSRPLCVYVLVHVYVYVHVGMCSVCTREYV